MDKTEIKKFIEEQLTRLDEKLKKAVLDSGWLSKVEDIGNKFELNDKETAQLVLETFLMVLGGTHTLDFVDILEEKMSWSREKAVLVNNAVKTEILQKIFDSAKTSGWKEKETELTEKEEEVLAQILELQNAIDEGKFLTYEELSVVERYKSAPKPVQEAFIDLNPKIKEVGDKFGLNENDLLNIEIDVTLALLDDDRMKSAKEMLKKLNLPEEKRQQILALLIDKIFKPVEEKVAGLKKPVDSQPTIEANQDFKDRFGELPESIRHAIAEEKIDDKLAELSKNQGLSISQANILVNSVYSLVLGTAPAETFNSSLKSSLGVGEDKLKIIVDYVNENILRGIRKYMQNIPTTQKTPSTIDSANDKVSMSIPARRLMGEFKLPQSKTDHTVTKQTDTLTTQTRKVDPYREIPE